MLYENREKFNKLSIKIGMIFSKIPLSPNQWTVFSLLPAVIAALYLASNEFLIAAGLFALAAFIDLIDGSVARVLGRTTRFGAYLDTITDRYVEFILIFGLFFAQLPSLEISGFTITPAALLFLYFFGAMMTTYAKAAAKEKELVKKELKGGILERAERMVLLFAGILLAYANPAYLVYMIAVLAVLANITALQRILKARKA